MVGFIHHDEDEENNLPSKLKNPLDTTWGDKFDFLDQFVPEDLPLPVDSSLLDFDSIKDWIEEMEEPEVEKRSETAPNLGGDVIVEASSLEDKCFIETEQLVAVDDSGECLRKESEGLEKPSAENVEKLLSLNSVVAEGLGQVSLVDEVEFSPVDESCRKDNAVVSDVLEGDNDESSDSESESESSSDSSSSSSSSSGEEEEEDDDDVDEGEKKVVIKEGVCEVKEEELEEGEIMETDADKMVSWSNEVDSFSKGGASEEIFMDDDDEDVVLGPIKSKNEVKDLPPVPPVDVTLQPSHQMLPVGVVNSMLGAQVIVEGGEKHNPLSEGSILWITEKRSPLGRVDEIFGPVKNPYYIVRYNSESEVPEGLHQGILVSFVPEFVDHVLNNKNLYQKGYDASGNHDEEVDEAEFSDDEQEAEYKRMLKMSKRGNKTDTVKPGGHKKSNNNNSSFGRNDARSNNYIQTKDWPPVQANNNNMQNQQFEPPIRPPPESSVQPGPSRFSPGFTAGPGMRPGFPHQGHQPNGMPFQLQNQEFAGGSQMTWAQQHQNFQPHHPMMNSRPPFQQGFNPASLTQNNGPPFPASAAGGSMVPPNVLNQVPLSMALQAQLAQLSMLSGLLLAGQSGGQPPSLPPQSAEAGGLPQFNNQGAAAASHQGAPPQFNHGATPPHLGGPPQVNDQGAASASHQGPPPQFNQGATPPQFNNPGPAPHQGGPPQFNNQGATPPRQGGPPQFNQGATPSHQEGNRPPFQHRGGGRSRGGRGRRGGGRRPFQSR